MSAHEFICGATRTGKSYHAQASAQRWSGSVLFINPQGQEMDVGSWTTVEPEDSLSALLSLLRRTGARVSFVPDWDTDLAAAQIRVIVGAVMQIRWTPPLLIIFDEVDQLAPQGRLNTPAHHVAQRGAKQGVWGWFITQHPSAVSKMVVRQCTSRTYFPLEFEGASYFRQYGIDWDQIATVLENAPKYSYMRHEHRKLTGPHKD